MTVFWIVAYILKKESVKDSLLLLNWGDGEIFEQPLMYFFLKGIVNMRVTSMVIHAFYWKKDSPGSSPGLPT